MLTICIANKIYCRIHKLIVRFESSTHTRKRENENKVALWKHTEKLYVKYRLSVKDNIRLKIEIQNNKYTK